MPKPTTLRPYRPSQASMVLETAWRYYHDGENQNDIAMDLGLSRGTVVNYLNEARSRGLVRISLNPEAFTEVELSRALCDKFGLKDALVVPRLDSLSDREAMMRVARATADWLPGVLEPGDLLGVSWGETIYEVSLAAPAVTIGGLTVVQLVGSRTTPLGFAAETCSSNLAQRFDAECINLHVPLILSSAELAATLRREPGIAEQFDAVGHCNKTLFAAGTCTPDSHVVKAGVVSKEELDYFLSKGATAVICAQFIDAEGRPIVSDLSDRMLCVNLEDMRNRDMGILVSAGVDRSPSLRAAIKGGFATHLVTCAKTAKALLELD
jgi:DNA-binding transcriptional regulator LsrR (DeoR family)